MSYILAVDDHPPNLQVLVSLLGGKGYDIRPALNGPRALKMIAQSPPDLILLDINMPEMNGLEVCKKIKSQSDWADIPIIFVSARFEVEDKVAAFEAGGVDYLPKPFEPLELFARVKTHLTLKKSQERLKKANQQLYEANAGLQSLNAIKDEFLGMVSHDLKNPLSSIMLFSKYMESRHLNEAKIKEIGGLITRAGKRMFRLIEDLLELNKLEQGQAQIQTEPVELIGFLNTMAAEFEGQIQNKEQRLNCDLGETSYEVRVDPMRLRQILENLMSNASKFSPPGSEISVSVETPQEGGVIVWVQDQGPGFTQEDMQSLFQRFKKLSAQPTSGESSTGLGLFISKKLAEAMGLRLLVDNHLPTGARMGLRF